ncbi:MAG: efflux RND transporter permease subunit [Planctomycetota bacterium]|jgi:multidrug efflux pump subunit AcrB|nr:efflux RND transporter permease subunit [Planctomycetota bacterium]MDP6838275.1 efflux RND transporter permease subunit [Planctomycetota bacterium]
MSNRNLGFTARLVELFVDSRLSLLLLLAAVAAGAAGLTLTPREEEPQIIVPMVDVFTQYPGATPADVERNVVIPLENLLRGLPGVEHIYSHAREGSALVSVRFTVGYNREQALVDTFTRIDAYRDRAPAGVTGWVVRPVDVDDVPILTLALSGSDLTTPQLRRIAEELVDELSAVEDAAMAHIIGGQPETLEVVADLAALEARRITLVELADALAINNQEQVVGRLRRSGQTLRVAAGSFLHSIEDVEQVVVAVRSGRAVHLRDVAEVRRGPSDVDNYTRLAFGPAAAQVGLIAARGVELGERPAITIAIAKRRGANAVRVTDQLLERVELSRGSILPSDLLVTVTRNDGNTANEKVNELVGHILVAILTVVLVLVIGLGWREALVVAIAVPVTFSVALFMDLVVGYTINRVTLFSLVLSLGLLVDDPIVDVENIHRHFKLGRRSARDAVIFAVNEVRPPLIMATLTVIVSFLPMFFITGMMGPYMAPMPFNIGVVMLTSLVVALTVTPWAALRLLRYPHANAASPDDATGDLDAAADNWMGRLYQRVVRFFLVAPRRVWLFLALVGVFFLGSVSLAGLGIVPLKMLPFADQNRMQLVIDAPEGTTLEDTDALVRELSAFLRTVPEVTYVTSYVGLASAHDFVGLVRHSFLRSGDEVGDLRFGLLPKEERAMQSHAIALRLRPELERIAARHGSQLTLVEVPPGPPVL